MTYSSPGFLADKSRPCLHVHESLLGREGLTDEYVRTEFFHPHNNPGGVSRALYVCSGCRHREECLTYAVEHEETLGIWGGTSARERQAMIKERRRETGERRRPLIMRAVRSA